MEKGETQLHGKHKKATANLPLISVITVVYNGQKVLEQTIISVLNQAYANIQYIIIDGASTDGTVDIIKKYDAGLDYWISEPDTGIYDAMNKAIDVAVGDWVYFLGAGDILLNVIHKLQPNLQDAACIYYGDVYRTDLLKIYDGEFSAFKLAVNNICHQSIFYPLDALRKYKFDVKYKSQADHKLNMQCYGDKAFQFKYLPLIISIYEGAGFSEQNLDKPFFKDKMSLIKANLPFMAYSYAYIRSKLAKWIKGVDYSA